MIRIFLLFVGILLSSCATMPTPTGYTGPDAGYVVLGLGKSMAANYQECELFYHDGTPSLLLDKSFRLSTIYGPKEDWSDSFDSGAVYIHALRPGTYHIFAVAFGRGSVRWNSKDDSLDIPFVVEAGRTTYLGNFQGHASSGRGAFGNAPKFIVTNRITKELAIAKSKKPTLPIDNVIFAYPVGLRLPEYIDVR